MLSIAGFVISALLLAATAWMAARLFSPRASERYWLFIAAAALQLTGLFLVLSSIQRLEPISLLLAQIALLAPALWWLRLRPGLTACIPRAFPSLPRDAVSLLLLLAIALTLGLSALQQGVTPIHGWDERGYHASRVLYWLQNRSLAPWDSHNPRQTTFPFLAEVFFAWPLLFVKSELLGRMVFWLAMPATTVGIYLLTRELRVGRRAALGAALLYASTPTVLSHAASLKSDAWLPLMVIGAAFFALRALRTAGHARWPAARPWLGCGLFLGLALAVKTTALALAPGLIVAIILGGMPRQIPARLTWFTAGALAGIVLSGAASLAVWNWRDHGSPLGQQEIRSAVRAEHSVQQFRIHAARVPLQLVDPPEVPHEVLRLWLIRQGQHIASATGADERLPGERDRGWPGHFRFMIRPTAMAYSLGGMLWLPILLVAALHLGRERRQRMLNLRSSRAAMLLIIQIPLLLGIIFMVRWMQGGPERFWLPPYALAVPLIAYFASIWSRRVPAVAALAILLLIWAVYPSLRTVAMRIDAQLTTPRSVTSLDEPYHDALSHIPSGSTILLIAGQSTRDYPLFAPRDGYANRILPWGTSQFDQSHFADRLADATHVLIEGDRELHTFVQTVKTSAFAGFLESEGRFREIPLASEPRHVGRMRLFERTAPAPP